jgi:hypothetical protein
VVLRGRGHSPFFALLPKKKATVLGERPWPRFKEDSTTMPRIASFAQNATPTSPVNSDADCRKALHFAFSQINAAAPAGLFAWLEQRHQQFLHKLLTEGAAKIDNAWGQPQFHATLADFTYAVSVAIAMYQLSRKRDDDVRRR